MEKLEHKLKHFKGYLAAAGVGCLFTLLSLGAMELVGIGFRDIFNLTSKKEFQEQDLYKISTIRITDPEILEKLVVMEPSNTTVTDGDTLKYFPDGKDHPKTAVDYRLGSADAAEAKKNRKNAEGQFGLGSLYSIINFGEVTTAVVESIRAKSKMIYALPFGSWSYNRRIANIFYQLEEDDKFTFHLLEADLILLGISGEIPEDYMPTPYTFVQKIIDKALEHSGEIPFLRPDMYRELEDLRKKLEKEAREAEKQKKSKQRGNSEQGLNLSEPYIYYGYHPEPAKRLSLAERVASKMSAGRNCPQNHKINHPGDKKTIKMDNYVKYHLAA